MKLAKDLKRLNALITPLINCGLDEGADMYEAKYVRFTNIVALLTTISVILYIPYSLLQGYYFLAALQTVDTFCVMSVMLLNREKLYTASRFLYLVVINFFVLINSCFIGNESRVHEFFYVSYMVPFLLFSVREYKSIIFGVVISVGCFYLYFAIFPFFTAYNLDGSTQDYIYHLNMGMKFILFGIAIFILANYNHLTEQKLAESNRKLQEQTEELKRSNKDLEHFAYIISHDLKAPARQINSFMKLLQAKCGSTLDKDGNELIDIARESSLRLSVLIEDMLAYSRVGRNLPPAGDVDTNEVIGVLKTELKDIIADRHAVISVTEKLPVLSNVHSTMIYQVFQNLISNGIKFNKTETPEVTVSCTSSGNFYQFTIRDNGIGINKQYAAKLFQMFQRLHLATEYEGTGMGLAICKKAIEFYGGKIWFESEEGKGTAFIFTIPIPENRLQIKPAAIKTDISTPLPRYAAAV